VRIAERDVRERDLRVHTDMSMETAPDLEDTTNPENLPIVLSDVTFSYSHTGKPVFSNVSLKVAPRARVVLVGANGAGKSTLLRLIGGRRRASNGVATVWGQDAFEYTANYLRVNLVTDDWDAELSLPVRQIVTNAVAASGVGAARISKLLEALGVSELLGAELHELSDGQRRRVQLFCKLLPERELVLLDEATNSLDVLSRASLLSFLREESEVRGCTVVFCTHIFDGLDGWATELAHLDGGKLLRHVDAESLPAGKSVYQVVSDWLLEYRKDAQKGGAQQGSHEAIAHALLAAAADGVALDLTPAKSGGVGDDGWSTAPKRNRPSSPTAMAAPAAAAVPEGWRDRMATRTEGAFGAHAWVPPKPPGVPEVVPQVKPTTLTDGTKLGAVDDGIPKPPEPPPEPPPERSAPSPSQMAPPSTSCKPSLPAPAAEPSTLPPAAARLAPALQGALALLTQRVSACTAAVGSGDAKTASAEAKAISSLWAQAELALKQFESAVTGEPRISPPVPAPTQATDMGMVGSGGGAVPAGWGSRQTACSEEELVRRGIIPPPTTLSQ